MSRPTARIGAGLALVVSIGLIGSVPVAQASDASLRATLKHAVPSIVRSQAKILQGIANYDKTHSLASLISATKKQNQVLASLESKVNGESASSQSGSKGKADIITGLRYIIGSNNVFAAQLERKSKHESVSKSKLHAAVLSAAKGNSELKAGGKLLKA